MEDLVRKGVLGKNSRVPLVNIDTNWMLAIASRNKTQQEKMKVPKP